MQIILNKMGIIMTGGSPATTKRFGELRISMGNLTNKVKMTVMEQMEVFE